MVSESAAAFTASVMVQNGAFAAPVACAQSAAWSTYQSPARPGAAKATNDAATQARNEIGRAVEGRSALCIGSLLAHDGWNRASSRRCRSRRRARRDANQGAAMDSRVGSSDSPGRSRAQARAAQSPSRGKGTVALDEWTKSGSVRADRSLAAEGRCDRSRSAKGPEAGFSDRRLSLDARPVARHLLGD